MFSWLPIHLLTVQGIFSLVVRLVRCGFKEHELNHWQGVKRHILFGPACDKPLTDACKSCAALKDVP